jgi:RHS repeat-associated protein
MTSASLLQFKDRYIYDWKNQLVRVEKENGEVVEFKYDVLGRRIEKKLIASNHTETTRYYYDGWQVIEERDGEDRLKAQYVYSGLDRPVEMRKYKEQGERSYFFHQNSIGSVYFITDEEGKIVEKVEYDPYGEPRFLIPTGDQGNPYNLSETSTIGNAYLFQGREYDYETSLYNFRMRYYDPELCRFISPDPEGYKDSVNLYQSFNQNPVNFTDPYGLQFRAGDTPYLTKKEEEEALKKIALSKEERERIKEALEEPHQCYENCIKSYYGKILPIMDLIGYWGLSSTAFNIALSESIKKGEVYAKELARKSVQTYAHKDFMYIHGWDKYLKWQAVSKYLNYFGKYSFVTSVGATTFSVTARLYCLIKCVLK